MNWKKSILSLIVMFALSTFITGCDDDEAIVEPDMGSGAMLRVIHASPDAPSVDIYAEGVAGALITDLGYGETSVYLDLDAGTYNIQLRGAGADPGSLPVYETGDLTIDDGDKYTALAIGLFSSMDADDMFRVLPLLEDFADPGAGNAAVRIIHGSADAPTVALDVGNDGNPEIPDFDRFDDTGVSGVPLPSGTALQIAVWTGNPLSRVTVFTTPSLPEGGELFVIATGLLSKLPREDDGFTLLAVAPTGTIGFIKQNPSVFALHASPDAPPVDILAGTTVLVQNLGFGELSAIVQVPPGTYALDFQATGSGVTSASATTPLLAAGERYLAIASGFLGGGTPVFQLIPVGDGFTLGGTGALARAVHASPDAPAVDIGTVTLDVLTPIPDFTDVDFTESSVGTGTAIPAGTYDIGVALTGQTAPLFTFEIGPGAGDRVFAVAMGSAADPPVNGNGFRLFIVDTVTFPWIGFQVMPKMDDVN